MNEELIKKLSDLIGEGFNLSDEIFVNRWTQRVAVILEHTLGTETQEKFLLYSGNDMFEQLEKRLGFLEALIIDLSMPRSTAKENIGHKDISEFEKKQDEMKKNKIFIVHGHNNEVKETVARFVEKIGLDPVILHEQANSGQTIIEKFEKYANVSYAIILLTPDDLGKAKRDQDYKSRARQNVILELGYFIGRLGRDKVCAIHLENVEIPTDFQGVLYLPFDNAGAWKMNLAQEFVEANLPIKIDSLVS